MNYLAIVAALISAAFLLSSQSYETDLSGQCVGGFAEKVCALDIKSRQEVLKSVPGIEVRCDEH